MYSGYSAEQNNNKMQERVFYLERKLLELKQETQQELIALEAKMENRLRTLSGVGKPHE